MILIAHRGLTNKHIKENTLEAFKNAIDNGYKGIELDIRMTKDNEIIVLHDKLINRTSNHKGNINKMMYKDLKKFNFGTEEKPAKIPLLKEVITKFSNIIIIIELKEKIDKEKLIEILDSNKTNNYYIMSFNKNYINNFKDSNYKIGLINNVFNKNNDLDSYDFSVILEDLFNKKIYDKLKEKQKEIILYGILKSISIKNKDILSKIKYIV